MMAYLCVGEVLMLASLLRSRNLDDLGRHGVAALAAGVVFSVVMWPLLLRPYVNSIVWRL